MGKFKSMHKNIKTFGVKMGGKNAKQVFKKHIKKPGQHQMEIDDNEKEQLLVEAKEKQYEKQKKIAMVLKSSKAGKPKRQQKIIENRLRTNDLPLFANKKAQNLKKAGPSSLSGATVFNTRRMTKKQVRKIMNNQRREDKAAKRAANTMETN